MRSVVVASLLLLCGCGKSPAPTEPSTSQANSTSQPAPSGPKVEDKTTKGEKASSEFPLSEGDANKKLIGLTDSQVEALVGKPDEVGKSGDLKYDEWVYKTKKYLEPKPSAVDRSPSGMVLCFQNGKVRKLYRFN